MDDVGLGFRPLRPAWDPTDPYLIGRCSELRKGLEVLYRRLILPSLRDTYVDLLSAAADADLLIAGELVYAAPWVAEKLGKRWVRLVLSPFSVFAAQDPSVMVNAPQLIHLREMGAAAYRLGLNLGRLATRHWSKPVRDLRRAEGLGTPCDPVFRHKFARDLVLALFSPCLAAPQPDWPRQTVQTGLRQLASRTLTRVRSVPEAIPPDLRRWDMLHILRRTLSGLIIVCGGWAFAAGDATPAGLRYVFPSDPAVVDAKRDLQAQGDGVADDTAALQRGIDHSSDRGTGRTRVLYLPNGVYRLSKTLVVHSRVGPWVFGETRDGVILRMADGVTDTNVTAVIRTLPSETNAGSADWFMRNLRNLTVDAGNNPRLDGIRWFSNNSGALKHVRVRGNGAVGVNLGFAGQNGPNLVQDVTIEGFDTGIRAAWIWGATLSRITIRHTRTEAVYVNATAVGIEDLKVEDCPRALRNEYPNDWRWWGGVVALVGGEFSGVGAAQAAITNTSVLYARDVVTRGFARAIDGNTPGGNVPATRVEEYLSHPVERLFPEAPSTGLRLAIKPEPQIPWETHPTNWVGVQDFGARPGDNEDDTAAIQAAIDSAAAAGKTTVCFPGIGGGDPNWYSVNHTVRVHGSVRHLIGLGFARLIDGESGRFLVDEASAPCVKFQNLQAFGGRPPIAENRSRSRALVVESSDLRILGTGRGDLFVTDCPSQIELQEAGQSLWARQLNPEGTSDLGLVQNRGGRLWALGVKHEGKGIRWLTEAGGQTEVFGLFNYGPGNIAKDDPRPAFLVRDGAFALMGAREISFGESYPIKVREVRQGETRQVVGGGWIGWALYRSHPGNPPTP